MQPEPRFASSLSEEISIEEERVTAPFQSQDQEIGQDQIIEKIIAKPVSKRRESKLDTVSIAVVVGMTALFVVFIFGLVTEFSPRILDTVLLSAFIGICVGVIAFALVKGDD